MSGASNRVRGARGRFLYDGADVVAVVALCAEI